MKLKDMKLTKKERERDRGIEVAKTSDGPEYPWGLRINLDNAAIEKLGIGKLPTVGTKMRLDAEVTVIATHANSSRDRENRGIELQIEKMGLSKRARSMEEAVDDGINAAS